jgi:hypothetical protein
METSCPGEISGCKVAALTTALMLGGGGEKIRRVTIPTALSVSDAGFSGRKVTPNRYVPGVIFLITLPFKTTPTSAGVTPLDGETITKSGTVSDGVRGPTPPNLNGTIAPNLPATVSSPPPVVPKPGVKV